MRLLIPVFLLLPLIFMVGCNSEQDLFRLVPGSESGIVFANNIHESDSFNILTYEYIYNGGGVALGDFNGDGMQDVFFTGNSEPNRMYLNEGNLKFKDVTEVAQVGGDDFWCAGVATIDINQDGWLDLYIATNTKEDVSFRTNLLYINQGLDQEGILTFSEEAATYGLADTSNAMNAVFFDYDNDLDLDVFIIVNQMQDLRSPSAYRDKNKEVQLQRVDRLYENIWNDSLQHPEFKNVSEQAGITVPGYSLGVNIVDINRDGWKDIYISNDFISNDVFYINNGDKTFTNKANQYFKHTSYSAMGNDIADINNDGLLDLVALDMLPEDNYRRKTMMGPNNYTSYINNRRFGYDFQFVRNTLQLNLGNTPDQTSTIFSDVALMSGIAATDWSWAPMVADFDHNGFRDIIITNGFPRDITDRDFTDYQADVMRFVSEAAMLEKIPIVKLKNYAYSNQGNLKFRDVTKEWGITEPSFSNGAAYGDLDGDGDLDYVVNNINHESFLFENLLVDQGLLDSSHYLRIALEGGAQNSEAIGALVTLKVGDMIQTTECSPYRGYLSSIESTLHFGLGSYDMIDSVIVIWPNGQSSILTNISADQTITLHIDDADELINPKGEMVNTRFQETSASLNLQYFHNEIDYVDFNVQPLLPHKLSQFGPGIATGDANGDGLDDLFIGGPYSKAGALLIQNTDGTFSRDSIEMSDEEKYHETLGVLFFDADNDGDNDLYMVSGGYEFQLEDSFYLDRLYLNEGGSFKLSRGILPLFHQSGSAVRAADFDKDGDLDLIVGGRVHPHQFPRPVTTYLLENKMEEGLLKFEVANNKRAPDLENIGNVSDILWTDFDQDGWIDLILAGEWMPITFLRNVEGSFVNVNSKSGVSEYVGWWSCIIPGDMDQDGDVDYIVGNFGENMVFDVSSETPVRIYAKDFDDNGGFDAVTTAYFKDQDGIMKEFTLHGRADYAKQLNAIKDQFLLNSDFAIASLGDLIPKEQMEGALVVEANYLRSAYLQNHGDGSFNLESLPDMAQVAPVYSGFVRTHTYKSKPEVLLVGNDFGMELVTGRCDAFNGLVLGYNEESWSQDLPSQSGFYVPGDAKGTAIVETSRGPVYFVTQNQSNSLAFTDDSSHSHIVIQPDQNDVSIEYQVDGISYARELYFGNGFLSQSSRKVRVPADAHNIQLIAANGDRRSVESSTPAVPGI